MGSRERRTRHKAFLKSEILVVAAHLIETKGLEALTIRRIADAIDYTSPTIYEYFENKEAILAELQKAWTRNMLELVQGVHTACADPRVALQTCAEKYLQFAVEQPVFYKAIMGMQGSCPEVSVPDLLSIRAIIKEWVSQAISDKKLDLDQAVDMYRSYLHGVASLVLTQRLRGEQSQWVAMLQVGVGAFLQFWKSP